MDSSYTDTDGAYGNASLAARVLRHTPGIGTLVGCPAGRCRMPSKRLVSGQVMHLNDNHRWTRERIADWLDSLEAQGIDLTVNFDEDPVAMGYAPVTMEYVPCSHEVIVTDTDAWLGSTTDASRAETPKVINRTPDGVSIRFGPLLEGITVRHVVVHTAVSVTTTTLSPVPQTVHAGDFLTIQIEVHG